jgi:hypothetical protein
MRQLIAAVLAALLAAPGCASATRRTAAPGVDVQRPLGRMDRALMTDYIQQLPVGSRIKITLDNGKVLHGTLLKRDADPIVVQLRTRVPEPPVAIDVGQIAALELSTGDTSVGRVVGIAVAAGAAATFGVLLLLTAIFAAD